MRKKTIDAFMEFYNSFASTHRKVLQPYQLGVFDKFVIEMFAEIKDYEKRSKRAVKSIKEKRKIDKNYARPNKNKV